MSAVTRDASPAYTRDASLPSVGPVAVALVAFFTLVDLFAAQAILPVLARMYHAGPASVGVAVNASTAGMAVGAFLTALLGGTLDRRKGIALSLVLLTVPSALLAFAPNLLIFSLLRAAQGLCMSCAFTLTLAYLGEAVAPERQTTAFAAYITGNVASNLVGRLISSWTAGMFGAPAVFITFAALNLAGAAFAYASFKGGKGGTANAMTGMTGIGGAFTRPLLAVYAIGFCILFAFIGVFSYVNFVLMHAPLSLNMMSLGAVYFVFAPSIVATPVAGLVARRFGPGYGLIGGLGVALIGLWLLAQPALAAVILGLVLVGLGTFFAQATTTGLVGKLAGAARGAANGLYLAAYFSGGLVGAAVLGSLFESFGWIACLELIAVALLLAAALGVSVARR